MKIIHISRCHLVRVRDALHTLQERDLSFRGYYRTLDGVVNDWRNQANDVLIRLRREVLTGLAEFAERRGKYELNFHVKLEEARKLLIEYGKYAETLKTEDA